MQTATEHQIKKAIEGCPLDADSADAIAHNVAASLQHEDVTLDELRFEVAPYVLDALLASGLIDHLR